MYKLDYTVTTLLPVIIAKNSGDPNMVATEDYISGSSILGALAGLYIHKKELGDDAHKDKFFEDYFLRGDIIFSNANICEEDTSNACIPAPFSLQTPKDDIHSKTGIDLLFKDLNELKEKTSPIGGYCSIRGTMVKTCNFKRFINFHHERDYSKGATKEGIIFNYESIDAGQTFKGMILARDKERLESLIQIFGDTFELNIGKSKTAQYGRVRLHFNKPTDFTSIELDADDEISLTFTSPAILLNEYGFSSLDMDLIKKALGEGVEIVKAFIKPEYYEGFSSVWGLKKPSEICVAAGSCLLIKASSEAIKRLKMLEFSGIGQRTNEGFGRFMLGMQKDNEYLSISKSEKEENKPTTPMPETVKAISKSVIQDYIVKQISLEAINDAKKFCRYNPPTKSLISRLEAMMRRHGKMEIDNLRKTAKDKLEDCNNGSVTLKKFLERKNDEVTDKVINSPLPHKIFSEINYDHSGDEILKDRLYREYWLTFFAFMRKEIKAQKSNRGG